MLQERPRGKDELHYLDPSEKPSESLTKLQKIHEALRAKVAGPSRPKEDTDFERGTWRQIEFDWGTGTLTCDLAGSNIVKGKIKLEAEWKLGSREAKLRTSVAAYETKTIAGKNRRNVILFKDIELSEGPSNLILHYQEERNPDILPLALINIQSFSGSEQVFKSRIPTMAQVDIPKEITLSDKQGGWEYHISTLTSYNERQRQVNDIEASRG